MSAASERAVYCASKHAVEGMTKAMAIEWGPRGIRVNTICPTFIRTPLTEPTFADPDKRAWIEDKIKLARVGEVEDIMGAVLYLASDASALVTGTSLLVDGGWTADDGAGRRSPPLEVAERAGVSQSAVSRVFTPGGSASAATAEKVRKAASELGYRPNPLARSLITGRSRIIGLVVAYLDNQFYPEALEKLSNALQAQGYHVLVFMASQQAGNIDTWSRRCSTIRWTGSSRPRSRCPPTWRTLPRGGRAGGAVQPRRRTARGCPR